MYCRPNQSPRSSGWPAVHSRHNDYYDPEEQKDTSYMHYPLHMTGQKVSIAYLTFVACECVRVSHGFS